MNRIRFVGLHMLTLIVYSSLGHLSFAGDEGKENARLVVLRLLTRFQCKEAFDVLVEFSRSARTSFIRGEAAYDLINYPDEEARPVLQKIAVEDSDQGVRKEAKKALKYFDDLKRLKNRGPSPGQSTK